MPTRPQILVGAVLISLALWGTYHGALGIIQREFTTRFIMHTLHASGDEAVYLGILEVVVGVAGAIFGILIAKR